MKTITFNGFTIYVLTGTPWLENKHNGKRTTRKTNI